MLRSPDRDQRIVQEMWTLANNEPLTLAALLPFGFIDRERYRRYLDDVILELTLEKDERTGAWSYELAILARDGGQVEDERVQYWLRLFFGREAFNASKRNFMMTAEARYTFPYLRR